MGGALYAEGTISIGDYGLIKDNQVESGHGGAIYGYGDVSLGNFATISGNSTNDSDGGAVYANNNLTVLDHLILKDNVTGESGALYADRGSITIGNNALMSGNKASYYGGALYAGQGGITLGDSATITANEAPGGQGGGVYAQGVINVGHGLYLSANTSSQGGGMASRNTVQLGEGAAIMDNSASNEGGGIYTAGAFVAGNDLLLGQNTSTNSGGGIYSGAAIQVGDNFHAIGNTSSGGDGGALHAAGGDITVGDTATILYNSAGAGSAIHAANGIVSLGDQVTVGFNTSGTNMGALYANNITVGRNSRFTGNQGGAVYASYNADFAGNALFQDNSATFGGAIYSYTTALGNQSHFYNNSATTDGGAIYATNTYIDQGSIFENNSASNYGGAVYSLGLAQFGPGVTLNGNEALRGGAVYVDDGGSLVFLDGGNIYNNHSFYNTGGAIYAGNGVSVQLTATTANLAFKDNWTGDSGNRANNAIHLMGGNDVRLNAAPERNITFWDSITGGATTTRPTIAINDMDTSGGTVRFLRSDSTVLADTTVYRGTFELGEGARFGDNDGRFSLLAGARLNAGEDTWLRGHTTFYGSSTLGFDLSGMTDGGTVLNLPGAPGIEGGNINLDLLSTNGNGTYTLVKGWGASTAYNPLTYHGEAIPQDNPRLHNAFTVAVDNNDLKLTVNGVQNQLLTWTGNDSNQWNIKAADNWTYWDGSGDTRIHFIHGDVVQFSRVTSPQAVEITPGGVVAGGVQVDGRYTFSGGPIITDKNASNIQGGSDGRLKILDNSIADLSGIHGNNYFRDGIALNGTLVVGTGGHFGTYLDQVTLAGNSPAIHFKANDFLFMGDSDHPGGLTYTVAGGTLSLLTLQDARVGFYGYTAPRGAVINSEGKVELGDNFNFVSNQADGDGGAIYAGSDVSLGGESIFNDNKADGSGGAVYAAQNVTLADQARLLNNQADSHGGAIYAGNYIQLGNDILLYANRAGDMGGALYTPGGNIVAGDNLKAIGNTAAEGGAMAADGDITLGTGSWFSGNEAVTGSGGALYSGYGKIDVGRGARFINNQAGADGGALRSGGNLIIGDDSRLLDNRAADNGGAIASYGNLQLGSDAHLAFNQAEGNGGAAWLSGMNNNIGDNLILRGNSAVNGGAVYQQNGMSMLMIADNAQISGNHALEDGGAFYVGTGGTLNLAGGTQLRNNQAGGKGGAIYSEEGNITLDARDADIRAQGNSAGGLANAFYINGGTLQLRASSGMTIFMDDPISGADANQARIDINYQGRDTGTIRFSGHSSLVNAKTTIHRGVFELAEGAGWGMASDRGSFTLGGNGDPAFLQVSATGGAALRAEDITFTSDAWLTFDPASFKGSGAILTLDSGNAVNADSNMKINISSIVRSRGDITTLLEALNTATDFSVLDGSNLYYRGALVQDTRLDGIVTLLTDNSPQQVKLWQVGDLDNYHLTWTGQNSSGLDQNMWNYTQANWENDIKEHLFFDGDVVHFTQNGANQDVMVNDFGVVVGDMSITGGNYSFSGGSIMNGSSSLKESGGRLWVKSGASATFNNRLFFQNGYYVEENAAMAYNGPSLNGYIINMGAFSSAGAALNGDINNQGRFEVTSGSVNGNIANTADFVFAGNSIDGDIENRGTFTFDVAAGKILDLNGSMLGHGQMEKIGEGLLRVSALSQDEVTVRAGVLGFVHPESFATSARIENNGGLETGRGGYILDTLHMADGALLDIAGTTYLNVLGSADISDNINARLSYTGLEQNRIYPVLKAGSLPNAFTPRDVAGNTRGLNDSGQLLRMGRYLLFATGDLDNLLARGGDTFNQRQTLSALHSLPMESTMREILLLDQGSANRAADMASGEGHASTIAMLRQRTRAQAVQTGSRLSMDSVKNQNKGLPLVASAGEMPLNNNAGRNNLWVDVSGYYYSADDDGNAARSELYGPQVAAGMDFIHEDGWLAGVSGQSAMLKSKIDGRAYDADVTVVGLTVYGGKETKAGAGNLRLIAGAGYSYGRVEAERAVRFPGFSNKLDSNYDVHAWQTFGEAAYALPVSENLTVEPYLNVSYDGLRLGGLRENGGESALKAEKRTYNNGASVAGMRAYLFSRDQVSLRANAGWMHTFGPRDPETTFAFREGGNDFNIKGATGGRDAAVLGLGLGIKVSDSLQLSIGYDSLFSKDDRSHMGTLQLKWEW